MDIGLNQERSPMTIKKYTHRWYHKLLKRSSILTFECPRCGKLFLWRKAPVGWRWTYKDDKSANLGVLDSACYTLDYGDVRPQTDNTSDKE